MDISSGRLFTPEPSFARFCLLRAFQDELNSAAKTPKLDLSNWPQIHIELAGETDFEPEGTRRLKPYYVDWGNSASAVVWLGYDSHQRKVFTRVDSLQTS